MKSWWNPTILIKSQADSSLQANSIRLNIVSSRSFCKRHLTLGAVKLAIVLCTSIGSFVGCGGGGSGEDVGSGCDGSCINLRLTGDEVAVALQRGVASADGFGVKATFAITDRVGNVLAVYKMPGAKSSAILNGQLGAKGGLEGIEVPATLAAISKAGTGAYLSSQGQAFSSRTAGLIIQEHFYPGERMQPGGPLLGVQFSQLPCSDVLRGAYGPRPLPLGLAADPGGIPLYKAGDVVGGIGVEVDGSYSLDREVFDNDGDRSSGNLEERIALAAAFNLEAPSNRRADKIAVGGKTLRFIDAEYPEVDPLIDEGDTLDSSPVRDELAQENLVNVPGFFSGVIRSGVVFGTLESGIINGARVGVPAAILAAFGEATRDGATSEGGSRLLANEVSALLDSALLTAQRARGAIRNPLDSPARVSIWVVDGRGTPLGFIRSQDAPVFGIDVALQKARTAAFFSSPDAANLLSRAGMSLYLNASAEFFGRVNSNEIFNGTAFSSRSIGNISRPFFTDGVDGNRHGPLALPFPGANNSGSSWSPFNTGLQLDLVRSAILAPVVTGTIPSTCSGSLIGSRLGNGMQIFPGSVPLYKDGSLVGAIGISGDGVDQDDLIAFFGASRDGLNYAGHSELGEPRLGFNAPNELRSDNLMGPFRDSRLRYINCPEAPFIGDVQQNVCGQ